MKNIIVLMLLALPLSTWAQRITVFEVRKNLQLSNEAPSYKDYYVSAGFNEGLQKGMIVDIVRRTPIHDSLKNQSQGELVMTIAKVQILHVQKTMSVGRIFRGTDAKQRPIADFNAVMIGDELDMNSAVMPVKKKRKRRTSSNSPKKPIKLEVPEAARIPAKISKLNPAKASAKNNVQPTVPVAGEVPARPTPSL